MHGGDSWIQPSCVSIGLLDGPAADYRTGESPGYCCIQGYQGTIRDSDKEWETNTGNSISTSVIGIEPDNKQNRVRRRAVNRCVDPYTVCRSLRVRRSLNRNSHEKYHAHCKKML